MQAPFNPSLASEVAQNLNSPEFDQNVMRVIRENPEIVIEALQKFERMQREKRAQAAKDRLAALNLKEIIQDSPRKGSEQLNIILIEFADFQCPFCAKVNPIIQEFMRKHGDEVTLVFKNLPLATIHPEAIPSAEAAWAAGQQNKFWEYHDALYANQENLGEELYLKLAKELGLDLAQFNRDRNAAAPAIQKDLWLANQLDIAGTPAFIMNGEFISGALQLQDFERILNQVKSKL